MGTYTTPCQVELNLVTVTYWPSQVTAVVLEMEVGGVLTGKQITLPAGTANTDTTTTLDLAGFPVGMGQVVRWKVDSAPTAPGSAWHLSLEQSLTPITGQA